MGRWPRSNPQQFQRRIDGLGRLRLAELGALADSRRGVGRSAASLRAVPVPTLESVRIQIANSFDLTREIRGNLR